MGSFEWHSEAKKSWDTHANAWNDSSIEMWERGSRKAIVPFFSKYLPKGSAIADLGCGDGYGSYKLHQAGYKVTGVDFSLEMIEKAKKREQDHLSFLQADITKLPFKDEEYTGLIAINSIEWTEQPLLALNEMHRVLKKEHLLCIGLLGPTAAPRKNSYRRLYGEPVICNTMMPWEFEKLALENGWAVIDGKGVYKQGVHEEKIEHLSSELKQALTFMWLFILRKV